MPDLPLNFDNLQINASPDSSLTAKNENLPSEKPDDTSDDEDSLSKLPQPSSIQISVKSSMRTRAMYYVKNNKVKHNIELKVYHIIDDVHNVKLLPEANCTCHLKKSCCHILAVEITNGKDISERIPNLSLLTRKKNNNKISGKKMTGQKINSVPNPPLIPADSPIKRVTRASKFKNNK